MHFQPSTNTARRLRGESGITLVELVVVVAIMGLISAMAIPRFTNYVAALRARGAANQLVSDIAYTRMMAVREGRTTSLTAAANVYTIVVENTDGSVRRTLRTVRVQNSFAGTTLTGDAGNGRVAFDSRGVRTGNSTAGFTLARLGRSQHLTISAIGRVTRDTPH
jgi:Tfp pilus assembly protein FimT